MLTSPVPAQDAPASDDQLTWAARVLDSSTRLPVEGAAVKIEGLPLAALSDSLGRFVMTSLTPGVHRVIVTRIGYHAATFDVDLHEAAVPVLLLNPQPLVLEQITAAVDAFENRRRTMGLASRVAGQRDLVHAAAPTIGDFIATRFGFQPTRCPGLRTDMCVRVRGRARPVRLYVDDAFMAGSWGFLEHYSPGDLYRVEVYPSLAMVRLYTPWYVEKMAVAGRVPRTLINR